MWKSTTELRLGSCLDETNALGPSSTRVEEAPSKEHAPKRSRLDALACAQAAMRRLAAALQRVEDRLSKLEAKPLPPPADAAVAPGKPLPLPWYTTDARPRRHVEKSPGYFLKLPEAVGSHLSSGGKARD